ncbi:MAG: family peptidase [Gammaproteobacteria bacterium]|nr:family peptidase [Gammaproteobacteria bacterium]
MRRIRPVALVLMCACAALQAQNATSFDAASAFGARPSTADLSLSPDGRSVAYIKPTEGQGSALYTLGLAKGAVAKLALSATGKPLRLDSCEWVSGDRLVCQIYAVVKDPAIGLMPMSRVVAVNADGTNAQVLSTRENNHSRGVQLGGGQIVDWLPDEDSAVLMTRVYLPDDHIGTRLGSSQLGLGVDRIDTRTRAVKQVEPPRFEAVRYITDGRGTVRIMATQNRRGDGMDTGIVTYLYRFRGSRDWQKLGDYNEADGTGFYPSAVDRDLNVAYGFKKKDGRRALYSVALDDSLREELVYARSDVDLGELISLGRRHRVVGVSYTTDISKAAYFLPEISGLVSVLSKALPQQPLLRIAGASVEEDKLLIFAGSDADPGVYYIFDRKAHQLETFLVARRQLEGVQLAKVRAVTYPAADGVSIPAYLTLPPGHEDAKGLPAIVLPHGGPNARDSWGFDWLSQFYASRGFAVLQPNFRGSSGYGDAWFQKNGFQSWPIAIGDVLAAGRWLVSQGIADPSKLAIVGWSYGGYAALQSAVVDPSVFKAVIAIAPVTDLTALKEEHRDWSDFKVISAEIGSGPQMHEGSPIEHSDKIKVPVLLFHAAFDLNVGIDQSKRLAARLTAAGDKCELVTWEDLDHHLDDSGARTEMLRKSDAFLRQALGM